MSEPDIVERFETEIKVLNDWNGKYMQWWDSWRAYIAKGGGGSWPRDSYESVLGSYAEDLEEAVTEIKRLRALTASQPSPRVEGGEK